MEIKFSLINPDINEKDWENSICCPEIQSKIYLPNLFATCGMQHKVNFFKSGI